MAFRMKRSSGVTLIEVMIATLLLSVIFLGAAAFYVTALKFLNNVRENGSQVYGLAALEHIAAKAQISNAVAIEDAGQTLKVRWDASFANGFFTPRNTPSNYADDVWVKYKIIALGGGRFRLDWAVETTQVDSGGVAYQPLQPKFELVGGSSFALTNPTVSGSATVLSIRLEGQRGVPAIPMTLRTDVALGALAKN